MAARPLGSAAGGGAARRARVGVAAGAPRAPSWLGVRHGLAALLCAALAPPTADDEEAEAAEAVEAEADGAPWHLRPRSAAAAVAALGSAIGEESGYVLRSADAAREGVCTENVGGWLALWACSGASGVGRFYGPASPLWPLLSAASYRSLAFDVGVECGAAGGAAGGGVRGCGRPRYRLRLQHTAVLTAADDAAAAAAACLAPAASAGRHRRRRVAREVGT